MNRSRIEPGPGQESVWDYPRPPRYYDVSADGRTELRAAWLYPDPAPSFRDLKDYVAFYPSKMDACWVDGEKVEAQQGDFYGGWITPEIVGPFKGAPGTRGW